MGETMHAIEVLDDDRRSLDWGQAPRPEPGPGEVVLRVEATAVNRADLVQRRGHYPPPPGASPILGLEVAGEVAELGEGVEDVEVGQAACALLTGGGYAEYAVAPAELLMPIPKGMEVIQAAALPEVFFTAWVNLFMEADLQPGEWALIHAGASGVGTAAIQLCGAFGARPIATASAPKLDFLRELGAEAAIDRRDEDFVEVCTDLVGDHGGVDVILDPVGGDYLERDVGALAHRGRLVIIGLLGGANGTLPIGRLLVKRLRVIGSVLRSRGVEEKAQIARQLRERVWPRFDDGQLRPIIHEIIPIEQADQAHELIASNQTIGKVILEVGAS